MQHQSLTTNSTGAFHDQKWKTVLLCRPFLDGNENCSRCWAFEETSLTTVLHFEHARIQTETQVHTLGSNRRLAYRKHCKKCVGWVGGERPVMSGLESCHGFVGILSWVDWSLEMDELESCHGWAGALSWVCRRYCISDWRECGTVVATFDFGMSKM